MFLTTAPMLQVPLNTAPDSMDNFVVIISPLILAVVFNWSNSFILSVPFTSPLISAFEQITLPSTMPCGPNTNFPVVVMLPVKVPSILTSPEQLISPVICVPTPIKFTDPLLSEGPLPILFPNILNL